MKLVEFTLAQGDEDPVWINPALVKYVFVARNYLDPAVVIGFGGDGDRVIVRGTLSEVAQLLRNIVIP